MREELDAFDRLWSRLFSTSIHLDSALAKEPRATRAILGQTIPAILRAPLALARRLEIRVPAGEPWSLDAPRRAAWAPARAIFRAMIAEELAAIPGGLEDFPPEITAEWTHDFGVERAQALADLLTRAPPISVRAFQRVGRERVRAMLEAKGAGVSDSRASPFGLILDRFVDLGPELRGSSGSFELQDEGSQVLALFAIAPQMFAPLLCPSPGDPARHVEAGTVPAFERSNTAIDCCAGAGGKTLAIADALANRGRIFAYDVSARKLTELRRRAKRAGLTSVKTVAIVEGEERALAEAHAGSADLVLIDAPCSGWGVFKRNPDAKWRFDPTALARLEALQGRLLDAFLPLLAPRGRLVYGACTFRLRETRARIDGFLAAHPQLSRGPGGFFGPTSTSDGFFMQAMVAP